MLKRLALALAAVALTVGLVGSAFYRPVLEGGPRLVARFPLDEWVHDLPRQLPWVLVFALFSASVVPLRAWRWGYALGPQRGRYADRYHAVAVGALAQNVVPGKLGEAVRALALSRFAGLPFFHTLATILVCKLLDLLALVLLVTASPAGPFFGSSGDVGGAVLGVAATLPVLVGMLALVGRYGARLADGLARRKRMPRIEATLRNLHAGIRASTWRSLLQALGATTVAIAAVATGYTVALHGVGVQAGVTAGVVVLGAITLGQSPPGVPAGLGMYYLSCSWSARALGATPAQAATLAVLTHLTTILTHATVGMISLVARRLRLRDFLPRRRGGRAGGPRLAEAGA